MNARLIFAASALPPGEARAILSLLCSSTRRARRTPYHAARDRLKRRFKAALMRVLKFAKHETMRKLHRYAFNNRPLVGQEAQPQHPDAGRIAFSLEELRQDLQRLILTEVPAMAAAGASDTLAELGYRDPWRVPAQATLDLVARRMNLISGLSDELFQDVQREISEGLNAGESLAQIAARLDGLFGPARAELVADTETAAAFAFASDSAARQAGVRFKQWIHSGLPKEPRPDHLAIDGLIVPVDEPYPVGDPPLRYPHDELGAAEDVINCGCISVPATEEDYLSQ